MVLRERGVGTVVVTMGSGGALLLDGDGAMHVPAVSVEAVDPTGAGDAFTAALAVSLAEGLSLLDAARRASIVAALTVTRIGTQAVFPSLAEVEKWLAAR
jgi:ribokinase